MERGAALLAAVSAFVGNPQFPVIAATAILVTVGVLWGRRWYLARTNGHAGGVAADAFAVVAPYLVGLLIPGLALFAAGGQPRPWYETAATLLALLALIRLVMFLLRLSLGRSRTIKAWELRATLIVWVLITAEVLGWLDPMIAQLDSIGLTGGKTRITIWSVLKAIATVTVFVVVSVWVARWIDRRINGIQELAPSTRIGIGKFAYAFLIAFGVLFGLQASGVDLTALTVFSGAIGLGLGFGLQAIAANFVSGFVLLIDRSIKPGDVISFTGATGTSTTGFGWVEELRGRHVVIRDRDGVATLVPEPERDHEPAHQLELRPSARAPAPAGAHRLSRRRRTRAGAAAEGRRSSADPARPAGRGTAARVRRLRDGDRAAILDRRSRRGRQQRAFRREPPHLGAVPRTGHHHPAGAARDPHPRGRQVGIHARTARRQAGHTVKRRTGLNVIPGGEYTLSFVRSPGPGGQNVNKVASACELRFHVAATSLLDEGGKQRLRHLAGRRLTRHDEIVIEAHRHRGQDANRRDAIGRLEPLIVQARHVPKPRKKTRPGRAAKARRLAGKRQRKETKRLRGRPGFE